LSPDIFQHRQVGKKIGDLKGAAYAQVSRSMDRQVRDVTSFEDDLTAGRRDVPAQEVEERRLASSVRANDRVQSIRMHLDADVRHRDERAKLFAQLAGLEDDNIVHITFSHRG
jgi:hypothetical protein